MGWVTRWVRVELPYSTIRTHLPLQEEIRGPPRPRRRQLQSQWDYHEPEEIRGPPKPRDTLVFSPVIWRKKSEDHLDLGTLFICHPEENFQINKVGTNIVGSESTISVDTSGTKNPATVSENPSFPSDQEISELPYSEEKSRSSRVSSSSELLCFELCFEKKIVNCLVFYSIYSIWRFKRMTLRQPRAEKR